MLLDIKCHRRLRNVKRLGLYYLLHNGKMTNIEDQMSGAITCTVRRNKECVGGKLKS